MNRRIFLKLSSFTAAAISISILEGCKDDTATIAISKPSFFSRFADQQTIHDAGQAYLQMAATENSKSKLISLLKENTGETTNIAALQTVIDKKVQQDFDNGNTFIANGWVLSLTEARQCALFSLL